MSETLSSRLREALALTGVRKVDLARAIGVKPQVIQFLSSSDTKSSRYTFEIASALGLNSSWLATGEGEMFVFEDPNQKLLRGFQRIPVLSAADVMSKAEGKVVEPTELHDWLAIESDWIGDFFAFTMFDGSMEPLLPVNSTLLVKEVSTRDSWESDTFVLVYAKNSSSILIRQVKKRGDSLSLVPKNVDAFKKIPVDANIQLIGRVMECRFVL